MSFGYSCQLLKLAFAMKGLVYVLAGQEENVHLVSVCEGILCWYSF